MLTPEERAQLAADRDATGNTARITPRQQLEGGRRALQAAPAQHSNAPDDLLAQVSPNTHERGSAHTGLFSGENPRIRLIPRPQTPHPTVPNPPHTPQAHRETNPIGDIIARVPSEDGTKSFAASMATVTDAIPGAVFGAERDLRQSLKEKHLTAEQHQAFVRGGEQLVREMMQNPEQWSAIMAKLDLNGDTKVSRTEAAAYAAAIDDQRTFTRASFDTIADELGGAKLAKLAAQYRDALANPPQAAEPPPAPAAQAHTASAPPSEANSADYAVAAARAAQSAARDAQLAAADFIAAGGTPAAPTPRGSGSSRGR